MATESVEKLKKVVDRALKDDAYAERLFKEPEAVAAEAGLSANEKLVVKQMNRAQFARKDAAKSPGPAQLSDKDLASVAGGGGFSAQVLGTASNMILGRSVIAATGGSYVKLSAAGCDCCAWKGGISMGNLVLPPF